MSLRPSEIGKILVELRGRGVSVWPDGGLLNIWPATKLTVAELECLRANKPAILDYLRQRNADLLPSDEVCREWRRKYCNMENHHEKRNITNQTGKQPAEHSEIHRAENR